ncbi:MAG: OmpA family protein, partial [Candidatus Eisenbacteria bacterium]|nr:OmpA family protein [Candidatus Eisenbacteria bacterium]
VCVQATALASQLGEATDAARAATLDLERGLQENLRRQLESMRAEAKNRQQEMYDALTQLEGKYARIRQDARGTIVSLADILFDFDKATLKRDVEFALVRVATILNQFPEMQIAVEGHTDNIGSEAYNLDLSKRRARAVFDFLVSQGVDAARMTSDGFGMTRPVADNATDEGRQRNRRVDLVIRES